MNPEKSLGEPNTPPKKFGASDALPILKGNFGTHLRAAIQTPSASARHLDDLGDKEIAEAINRFLDRVIRITDIRYRELKNGEQRGKILQFSSSEEERGIRVMTDMLSEQLEISDDPAHMPLRLSINPDGSHLFQPKNSQEAGNARRMVREINRMLAQPIQVLHTIGGKGDHKHPVNILGGVREYDHVNEGKYKNDGTLIAAHRLFRALLLLKTPQLVADSERHHDLFRLFCESCAQDREWRGTLISDGQEHPASFKAAGEHQYFTKDFNLSSSVETTMKKFSIEMHIGGRYARCIYDAKQDILSLEGMTNTELTNLLQQVIHGFQAESISATRDDHDDQGMWNYWHMGQTAIEPFEPKPTKGRKKKMK